MQALSQLLELGRCGQPEHRQSTRQVFDQAPDRLADLLTQPRVQRLGRLPGDGQGQQDQAPRVGGIEPVEETRTHRLKSGVATGDAEGLSPPRLIDEGVPDPASIFHGTRLTLAAQTREKLTPCSLLEAEPPTLVLLKAGKVLPFRAEPVANYRRKVAPATTTGSLDSLLEAGMVGTIGFHAHRSEEREDVQLGRTPDHAWIEIQRKTLLRYTQRRRDGRWRHARDTALLDRTLTVSQVK